MASKVMGKVGKSMKKIIQKYRTIPKNLRATLIFAIASFMTSGINYITTPIFTRLLSTSEYGVLSAYNALYAIVSVAATMTLSRPGVLNVGLYEYAKSRWKYLSSMLGVLAISTLTIAVLIMGLWSWIRELVNLPISLVILMLLTCLIQPAITFWTSKNRYEYNYRITFYVTVGSAVLSQIVSVLAVLWCAKHTQMELVVVRLWSAGAINLTVAAVLYVYILMKGRKFVDFPLWKKTLAFATPLIPHYLGFAILNGTDKIMIREMVGSGKAGVYSLAAVISTVGQLLWQGLCVSVTPFMYDRLGKRKYEDIRAAMKPLLRLVGVCSVMIAIAAPEIIRILSTKEYLEGVYAVPPIAAGVFMHVMYDVFSNVSFFYKRSFNIMLATVIAALANIVMNYFCILQFGYIAAGYTTLVSYGILALLHYVISRKIEKERVFDGVFSLKISAVVISGCMLCSLIYPYTIVRYILLALGIVLLIWKRKYFISAISNMGV